MRSNSIPILLAIQALVDDCGGTFTDDGVNLRVETPNYSIITGYRQNRKTTILGDILKQLKSGGNIKPTLGLLVGILNRIANLLGNRGTVYDTDDIYLDVKKSIRIAQRLESEKAELLEALEWSTSLLRLLADGGHITIDPHYPKPGESNYSLKKAEAAIKQAQSRKETP